jgi:archaellum component FlaF (FlaF/FlaG flagellin family)
MPFRPIIALAAAAALILMPAAVAEAAPSAVLKVRSCQVGDSAKQRQATFYGRMRAVNATARMMMRFTVVDRSADGTALVPAPQLAQWRRSRPRVKTFGYAQTVTGLQVGGAYAAIVEYRWIDANGKTIRTARRTSSECRQDGKLPNLTLTRVAARRGDASGTLVYSVDVTNLGSAEARAVVVDLFVDDAGADAARIDSVKPGETVTVRVSGPACTARLKAVVDRQDAIHETTEDDNVLRARCPALDS